MGLHCFQVLGGFYCEKPVLHWCQPVLDCNSTFTGVLYLTHVRPCTLLHEYINIWTYVCLLWILKNQNLFTEDRKARYQSGPTGTAPSWCRQRENTYPALSQDPRSSGQYHTKNSQDSTNKVRELTGPRPQPGLTGPTVSSGLYGLTGVPNSVPPLQDPLHRNCS